ncbi:alpha/beta fold hydrolase [Candidatus Woesearchaeota archaeon]|nr:alpha/beta fold hydrolase [Candidatus Woesearchaeota archaeon]
MLHSKAKRVIIISLLAIAFIIVIAAIFLVNYVKNDLTVYLSTSNTSLHGNYGNVSVVRFSIRPNTGIFCTVSCEYSFSDQSSGIGIDSGSFSIRPWESFERNYSLKLTRRGRGQFLYNFDATCRNIQSIGCLSGYEWKSYASLITFNYDYTEAELKLKETLHSNLTAHIGELSSFYGEADLLDSQINQLESKMSLKDLSAMRAQLNDEIQSVILESETFRTLWNEQEYALLNNRFQNRTEVSYKLIEKINSSLNEDISSYNSIVLELNRTYSDKGELGPSISIAAEANDTALQQEIISESKDFNDTVTRLLLLDYENVSEIKAMLEAANFGLDLSEKKAAGHLGNISEKATRIAENELKKACLLKGYCKTVNYSFKGQGRISEINSIRSGYCTMLNGVSGELENASYYYAEQLLGESNRSLNGPRAYSYMLDKLNISSMMNQSSFLFQLRELESNLSSGGALTENTTLRFSLNLTESNDTTEFYRLHCIRYPNISLTLARANISQAIMPEIHSDIIKINQSLGEPFPECCVLGECRSCCTGPECRNDPKTYPIILVHGHSIGRGSVPEFTAEAFGPLQRALQSEGYLNAGILYPNSSDTIKPGDWGLSGKPVSVSVAYYYDIISDQRGGYLLVQRSSHEITVYAVRLKELVDIVKQRTGKDKVIIVAHSMGGLVARSYMQIFGDESVSKLIMIGTPNSGINKTSTKICSFLGEEKECEDMSSGSFFLRKLNDPQNQPQGIPVYNIIGTGCNTEGEDGDGIITARSAYIDGANNYYARGNCSASLQPVLLHVDMLNPEKHPEIMSILRGILKQE